MAVFIKFWTKPSCQLILTELFSMFKDILKSPFSQFLDVFCKDIMSELPFMKKTQGHSNMIKQM